MPRIFLLLLLSLTVARQAGAQLLKVSTGSDITILAGTVFNIDSMILVPSTDFTLVNVTLDKSSAVNPAPINSYIYRVYNFSTATNPFSGTLTIHYADGAELNGIPEPDLTLNIYDGAAWGSYSAGTRNGTSNFVQTNNLSNVSLNKLTLASQFAPLPLQWLSFNATLQNNKQTLLQWSTAQELGTKSFFVEHSLDGAWWLPVGQLSAVGFRAGTSNYSFVHHNPVNGLNYYRIKQTDVDSRFSYSVVRKLVSGDKGPAEFTIFGNLVTNNLLTVKVNEKTVLEMYTAASQLVFTKQLMPGTSTVDLSRLAKGTYFLKAASHMEKIVIQ